MPLYEELEDDSLMPYGGHVGKKMERVPASYLLWMWNDGVRKVCGEDSKRGIVARYIRERLACLSKECDDVIVKREDEE
jgi:hypothetical protein